MRSLSIQEVLARDEQQRAGQQSKLVNTRVFRQETERGYRWCVEFTYSDGRVVVC